MKVLIFAVKDRAIDTFMQPFPQMTVGAATRAFSDRVNDKSGDNGIAKHPDDFDLWQLASYDDQTGVFSDNSPVVVARAKDLLI